MRYDCFRANKPSVREFLHRDVCRQRQQPTLASLTWFELYALNLNSISLHLVYDDAFSCWHGQKFAAYRVFDSHSALVQFSWRKQLFLYRTGSGKTWLSTNIYKANKTVNIIY